MSRRSSLQLWVRIGVVLLLLAGSSFALLEFRRSRHAADLPTAPARESDFLVLVKCRGELVARRSIQVVAPLNVPDLQIVWLAPPGSEVKEGAVVIRFDPSRSQQDLREKTVALQQAQATLDQAVAQARITADQDKLDLSKAQYDAEKARLEASKQSIVSAIQGQESTIDLGLAEEKTKLQATTSQLHRKSDEAKIASLTRLRDAAQADVVLTQHRLGQMELKSPLNGVITYASNTSQGWMNAQPFKIGDHAFPGAVLAEIPDLTTLEMEGKVDEVDRGRINIGDAVLVHVDAFPEKALPAKLVSISPLTEQSFNEWPPTQSFRAFAKIDRPDSRMRPGMNAGADVVETKLADAISIPANALFTLNGKPVVYRQSNGKFVASDVRVRARNPDEVAVDGLTAGNLVALVEPAAEARKEKP